MGKPKITNDIPTASGTSNRMVLIVDDDQSIVDVLQQALDFKGYNTRIAIDSEKAFEIFQKEGDFDVVVTDLMMPKLSGTQLLEKIKQADPNCEVIVLTGFGSSDTAIEALQAGAHDYIKKPTNIEELYISVEKAIEKRKLKLQNLNYQLDLERLVEERSSELLKTQEFLHSVLESSTEYFIIATDTSGLITLFNSGAERLFGYDRSEVEGKKSILYLSGMKEEDGQFKMEDFLKGSIVNEAKSIISRDNKEISISMTVTPIQNSEDEITGYIWIGKDITERLTLEGQLKEHTENLEKRVEERTAELLEQNKALEETFERLKETQVQLLQANKMTSLGQLAAGVAHEINNPIGFINSNLNTLKKYIHNIEEYLHASDRILNNGGPDVIGEQARLRKVKKIDFILDDIAAVIGESLEGTDRVKSIVQELKDFSYQDQDEKVPYDLNKGLKSTMNIVWNELKNKVEVIEDFGDVPIFKCYRQQVNQVFMNLLLNAAQAIEDRGTITVRTYADDKTIYTEISDTGNGISKQNIARIFEPFFTTKNIGEGTGLGLSISYRIIEKHGGTIEVESKEREGSTFRVKLPIKNKSKKRNATRQHSTETV